MMLTLWRNTNLQELWAQRTGVLSMQVLQEFYVNVTRKIAGPLSKASARAIVNKLYGLVHRNNPGGVSAAFRIEDEACIGFWDALIVAAAVKAGAEQILSEDLNAGQIIAVLQVCASKTALLEDHSSRAEAMALQLPSRHCLA